VRAGRCAEGAEHLERIIAAEPANTESVSLLGRAYLCAGKPEQAALVRQRFAELAKGDQAARENRVQSDHLVRQAAEDARAGRPNEALALLQQALAQDPGSDAAYTLLAKIHFSAGHYDLARQAVDLALKNNPYRSDALYVRGRVLAKQDDLEGARQALVQTTLVNPTDAEALYVLGQVYLALDQRDSAVLVLEKAVALDPGDESYAQALASARRGR